VRQANHTIHLEAKLVEAVVGEKAQTLRQAFVSITSSYAGKDDAPGRHHFAQDDPRVLLAQVDDGL